MGFMTDELERFVASLAIPADRKAVVLAELLDHVACAADAARREGRDPDEAARASLGSLDVLRRSLEAVEPAFRISRVHAIGRGIAAALLVALVVDRGGSLMHGIVGGFAALAIAALLAPPRMLDVLRAELRAPRVRGTFGGRSVPIGPALAYAYTVLCAPFLVWITLIVARTFAGTIDFGFETPLSAFAVMLAVYVLLLVEGLRARRTAA